MREKTRPVIDLHGLLKRESADPVPIESMRIGRDPEPLDLVLLDPATLAEALHEARRHASRCYARDAWAVYMRDPGALTDAAMLIEQQAAEVARLRAALFETDRLLPHWDEIEPAREVITRALEGGAA